MPESWRRHDLLRVESGAWSRMLSACPPLVTCPHVAQWVERGWPLIVRRPLQGDDPKLIPIGLALPPADGKRRLTMRVAPEEVSERLPPLTLRDARGEVPLSWRETVDALLELASRIGVTPRVFGSLLWQRFTGLSYLSTNSDIDLLWPVSDPETADKLVLGLAEIERNSPVRCDGEIFLPDGSGVHWREWHGTSAEVLVKVSTGVRLRTKRDVFVEAALHP